MSVEQDVYRIRHATYGEEVRESIADAIESMNVKVEATEEARQDAIHAAEQAEEYRDETQQIVDDAVDDIYEGVMDHVGDSVVATAENLTSDRGTALKDSTYVMRRTGAGSAIGTREEISKITGGTVAWNQLCQPRTSTITVNGVTVTANADGSVTLNGTATSSGVLASFPSFPVKSGHKYALLTTGAVIGSQCFTDIGGNAAYSNTIRAAQTNGTSSLSIRSDNGAVYNNAKMYIMAIDLTANFGPTIADYLYSLETATAGSGIAKLLYWGFDVNTYHAYDPVSLQSVCTSGHRTVGFNVWDETWKLGYYGSSSGSYNTANDQICTEYIPVLPNTTYNKAGGGSSSYIKYYDSNKAVVGNVGDSRREFTTPNGCYYITISFGASYGMAYKDDTCINLSNPAKNGTYEPYDGHTYPIAPVELRGIPKLDANNELYYDGDVYMPSGKVNRRYAIVDLGTLTWTYGTSSGNNYLRAPDVPNIKGSQTGVIANVLCPLYPTTKTSSISEVPDKSIMIWTNGDVYVRDSAYTNAATFKTAMSGVYLVYELATPTTESATPYSSVQICHPEGTEQFVDAGTRDIAIPVQVTQRYMMDVAAKLDRIIGNVEVRENDDRQALLGTIMDVAKDSYSELRSAPVHTQLIQNGTTFSRIDKTSLELSAIKGRTVAFNQLLDESQYQPIGTVVGVTAALSNHKLTLHGTTTGGYNFYLNTNLVLTSGHRYLLSGINKIVGANILLYNSIAGAQTVMYMDASNSYAFFTVQTSGGYSLYFNRGATGIDVDVEAIPQLFDITAEYNGAIDNYSEADAIVYVRQRMPLDYYAYNAGTLTAPVVSGLEVTGFNAWDEEWELGQYNASTGAKSGSTVKIRCKNQIPVMPNTTYYFNTAGIEMVVLFYDGSGNYISGSSVAATNTTKITPSNAAYATFFMANGYGTTYHNDICINLSSSRNGEYQPYQHSAISLPSTRLDGVGTAQDYIEVVEDGENDYSLVLIRSAHLFDTSDATSYESVDYGTSSGGIPYLDISYGSFAFSYNGTSLSNKYTQIATTATAASGDFKVYPSAITVYDSRFTGKDQAIALLASENSDFVVSLVTPTQTVIAEHLTLAEVSAIAENGGIISVVNSNGDIVQPDLELDGFKIDTITPALNEKAPINSPAFTGTPTAPTPSAADNSTKIATTAFVHSITDPINENLSYLRLREEEDRQILFGSIVDAVEDEYDELRSAPIHTAITIGGSVYPRIDNTRMAIDRMLGRTVAFNQLIAIPASSASKMANGVTIVDNRDGSYTISTDSGGATAQTSITLSSVDLDANHIYLGIVQPNASGSVFIYSSILGALASSFKKTTASGTQNVGLYIQSGTIITTPITVKPMLIDLTSEYGTTLADSIYAMEQSTPGSGVAYVRARMPLGYYAPNAGTLTAPVVSGWEVGSKSIVSGTMDASNINASGTITINASYDLFYAPITQGKSYLILGASVSAYGLYAVVPVGGAVATDSTRHDFTGGEITASADGYIAVRAAHGSTDVSIHELTALTIPSTTLNGVGSAQDYIEAVEVGENDYSLVLHTLIAIADLGAQTWTKTTSEGLNNSIFVCSSTLSPARKSSSKLLLNSKGYVQSTVVGQTNVISTYGATANKLIYSASSASFAILDSAYNSSDADTFKTAMNGQYLAYELATPTTTTIAEHLTLAEVSSLAENGGIVSIVNENGDIVQPDFTVDTVISKSAS